MILRSNCLVLVLAFFYAGILNMAPINFAYAQNIVTSNKIQGKVIDIINVNSYTYVEVDTGTSKVWAAGPTTPLKTGDTVTFSTEMQMKDFYSESMDRKFPLIYFISQFVTDAMLTDPLLKMPPAHAQIKQLGESFKGVNKVKRGNNISEVHSDKDKLNGKIIRVRGQVTRFASEIMGTNWLHIKDSSSLEDLTITSDNTVAVGDVVIIEGKLELDKDFDYGYVFPVIVQNAKVTKE